MLSFCEQFFHQQPDLAMEQLLKILTFIPLPEIEQIIQKYLVKSATGTSPSPWLMQKRLAREIVLLIHGSDGLESALRTTDAFFNTSDSSKLAALSREEFDDLFREAPVVQMVLRDEPPVTVLDIANKLNHYKTQGKVASHSQN